MCEEEERALACITGWVGRGARGVVAVVMSLGGKWAPLGGARPRWWGYLARVGGGVTFFWNEQVVNYILLG